MAAEGVVELKAAYDEGVRTIVDVTTFDLGRDIGLLEEVSRGSGVHIIACTGQPLGSAPGLHRIHTRRHDEGCSPPLLHVNLLQHVNIAYK